MTLVFLLKFYNFSASLAKRTDQLGASYSSLYSDLDGNPPLWITHIQGIYHDDIFVNNARILVSQSNIQVVQKNGNEQVSALDCTTVGNSVTLSKHNNEE